MLRLKDMTQEIVKVASIDGTQLNLALPYWSDIIPVPLSRNKLECRSLELI